MEAMSVARAANRYLDEQAPWKSVKTDRERAATTVFVMIQVLNGLKVLFAPYVPFSSQRLHELLGFGGDVATWRWEPVPVPAGQALPTPTPLFAKFDPPAAEA
jgi:methionyl-tRNA synthetase